MRVGLVVYGSLDAVSGGNLYDRQLVDVLRRRGIDVEQVSLPRTGYPRHLTDNASGRLFRRLRDADFDVLLQDELVHPSLCWLNRRLRRHVTFPLVGIVHHLRSSEAHAAWRQAYHRPVERFYLRGLDAFIFNSRCTQHAVQAMTGDPRPSVVARPGGNRLAPAVSLDDIRTRSRAEGPLRVLFVGNVIPRKGLPVLVSALERIAGRAWHLDVVGDEAVEPDHARAVRLQARRAGLSSRVRFHGLLSDTALAARFANSHVLAVPALYEGFGIVYLEGMGFGLPAVACEVGAVPEIVEHESNGFLVPPGDAAGLARCLGRLVDDRSLLERLSVNASRAYARHLTWDESLAGVPDFLVGLIGPRVAVPGRPAGAGGASP